MYSEVCKQKYKIKWYQGTYKIKVSCERNKRPSTLKQNKLKLKSKRKRPIEHNIYNKLHTIANKCLKHLGLYQSIQP